MFDKSKNSDKKTNRDNELIAGTIVLCIAVIFLTILFPKIYGGDTAGLEPVTATVIEKKPGIVDNEEITYFTYTFKERNYKGFSPMIKNSYKGQEITLYIDPESPTHTTVRNDLSRVLYLMRMLSVSTLLVVTYIAIKRKFSKS